jgi:iron(III) transport system permease protein
MLASAFMSEHGVTLAHVTQAIGDTRAMGLLLKSLLIATGASVISLLVGLPLAYLLARTAFWGRGLCRWLYLVPLFIPSHVHALAWLNLIGEKGLLTRWLMAEAQVPLVPIYGAAGTAAILALAYFPFVVLLTLTGLEAMDRRLEEAALLNERPLRVVAKVTLPLCAPYIISGAVFVFLFSLFNYGVPALLGVHTYPVEIFAQFSAFYNDAGAAAGSLPVVLVAVFLLYFQRRYMGARTYVTISSDSRPAAPPLQGTGNVWTGILAHALVVSVVVLPLAALFVQAGPWASYRAAIKTSAEEMCTTAGISAAAATLTLILGYGLSMLIENRHFKAGRWLDLVTFLPFAFPATVVGIGMIVLWNRPLTAAIYGGSLMLIMAYMARFIPFAVRTLTANVKQIHPHLAEAALLGQPSRLRRAVGVYLPLAAKGLCAGWVIVFILCMGELGATLLVIPPGKGTVALKIYTLMHYGAGQVVAALALLWIGVNLIAVAAMAGVYQTIKPNRV